MRQVLMTNREAAERINTMDRESLIRILEDDLGIDCSDSDSIEELRFMLIELFKAMRTKKKRT